MARAVSVDRIAAGPWDQSCYVLTSAGGDAVIVDPGGRAPVIAARVTALGADVRGLVATHGHHDHVGALGALAERYGAPFAVHSGDARMLERVNLCRRAFHGLGPVAIPPIDLDLSEVGELRLGELEIEVVPTPGHSPGSVCLAVGELLVTGDTLMATHVGTTELRDSDPAALEESVRGLAVRYRPDTTILPGHGRPGRLGDAVAQAIAAPEARR